MLRKSSANNRPRGSKIKLTLDIVDCKTQRNVSWRFGARRSFFRVAFLGVDLGGDIGDDVVLLCGYLTLCPSLDLV